MNSRAVTELRKQLRKEFSAECKRGELEAEKEIHKLRYHVIEIQPRHLSKSASIIQVLDLQQEVKAKAHQLLLSTDKAEKKKTQKFHSGIDVAAALSRKPNRKMLLTHESKETKSSPVAQKPM